MNSSNRKAIDHFKKLKQGKDGMSDDNSQTH